jgi:hypothetical protein
MQQQPESLVHPSFAGRIGIGRADVTPPVGIYSRCWGAAKHDVADSIHRPLTLSALTCSPADHGPTLVLVDADLSWWRPLEVFHDFQRRLLDELSIDPENFIFSLSHTHAAPPLMVADESLPGGDLLNAWLEDIYQATLEAVRDALHSQFEGVVDWHTGSCRLAAVRDLPDPDAPANRIVCGYNPQEKADDTLLVGRVSDSDGQLHAVMVNYACHPTTLAWENTAISPDYVGAMRATIEAATGAVAMFTQGASGDLAPRHQYVGDTEVADRHGRQLGHAALATLQDMEPSATELAYAQTVESGAPLAVWRHRSRDVSQELLALRSTVDLPLKDWPSTEELEQQRQDCNDRALEERLRRKRDIRRTLGDGQTYALPVWTWRIGDAILVGSCCEPYSILQQELRRRFPATTILCMNLINGSIGYLPPAEQYDLDVYQAWQTPFARGSLELLIDKMAESIQQLLGKDSP